MEENNSSEFLKSILEAALFAAARPLDVDQLCAVISKRKEDELEDDERRELRKSIRQQLKQLKQDYAERGVELIEVASGYRFQVKPDYAEQVSYLWTNRPSRYSRAMLETLVLIAYRQPTTRGQIESIRGVSVSSHIMKTLLDYNWIRIVGHRNTPGRPMLYGTTRAFLDHFGLKALDDLPPLDALQEQAKTDAVELRQAGENEVAKIEAITKESADTADDDTANQDISLSDGQLLPEAAKIDADLLKTLEEAEQKAAEINLRTQQELDAGNNR